MNKFFTVREGIPYFTETAMEVPKLRQVVEKFQDNYEKFAAYLYHMTSFTSAYFDHGLNKEAVIIDEFLPEFKGKKLPKLIYECIDELNSFKTAEMRMLESALHACDKLGEYLTNVDFSELDDNGRLLHSPTQTMNSLGKIAALIEGIQKVRETVKKGMQSEEEYYGDRELNMFDRQIEKND